MKIERVNNTINGTLWGGIEKIASILLPFIVRTVLIKVLGAEYLGLSSLFTSVLQVLNLTELGFGTAAVYAMYRPIAEDDFRTVGGILIYLKKIYKSIGIVMFVIGILVIPLLPYLIEGNVPNDVNIYVIYVVYIVNTSISYFLFAYKSSLLSALQRNDILSKVGVISNSLLNVLQIVVLIITPNYYFYTLLIPCITLLNNYVKSNIVDRCYKKYLTDVEIDEELKEDIKRRIFPLMSTKLASVLINAADTVVISAFLGLKDVALYNNYYYIINAVMGFLLVIYSAMQAGIGNSLVVDKHEKIISSFNRFCFINNWLVTFCTVCLLCLYQPFMKLWLGVDYLLPFGMVIMFCIYFYANTIQRIVVIYKDAAGIWKEDMLRCYLSCGLNLLVNILTIRIIGLYGVIGSTVLANIVGLPWMGYILYRTVFMESSKKFYINEIKGAIVAVMICTICYLCCEFLPEGIVGIVTRGMVCIILSNILLFLVYGKSMEFEDAKQWILNSVFKRNMKG